uniref:Uncharacterized protein n=1 Tax=Salmonella phage vB_SEnST11_KE22 TaxID=3161173 RepID=A0AAU8GEH4_9CAUD
MTTLTAATVGTTIHQLAKNIITLKQAKEITGINVRGKEAFFDAAFNLRDELEAKEAK